jgi:hypothetical protein
MERKNGIWLSKRFAFTVIVIVLMLAGYFAWGNYSPIYTIQASVKKQLLDPESAQFTDVKFYRSTGFGCGFVNSKNSMGGYVGKKLFVAPIDGQAIIEPTLEALGYPDKQPNEETDNAMDEFLRTIDGSDEAKAYSALMSVKCPEFMGGW